MTVESKTSQTFGFVMYTEGEFNVHEITVTGYKVYSKESFALYWILLVAVSLLIIVTITYFIIELRLKKFKLRQREDKNIIQQSLHTFANFIDANDPYTRGHSTRVAMYTKEIARRMGMSEAEQDKISYIALLHDVGKIGIPNEILNKPAKLTDEERKVIQMHTTIGADIPLFARIICVADSYDAMASDRCYHKRLSENDILNELVRCTGNQFDPEIVKYMIEMIKDGFVNKVHGGDNEKKIRT